VSRPKFELCALRIQVTRVTAWTKLLRRVCGTETVSCVISKLKEFCTWLLDKDSIKEFWLKFPISAQSRTGAGAQGASKLVFPFHCQKCPSWNSFSWPLAFELCGRLLTAALQQLAVSKMSQGSQSLPAPSVHCAPHSASTIYCILSTACVAVPMKNRISQPYFY
jgi:hypothetical protein